MDIGAVIRFLASSSLVAAALGFFLNRRLKQVKLANQLEIDGFKRDLKYDLQVDLHLVHNCIQALDNEVQTALAPRYA
jgi:hypothetical protein